MAKIINFQIARAQKSILGGIDYLYQRLGMPYLEWKLFDGAGAVARDSFLSRDGIIVSDGVWQYGVGGLEWKADGTADYLNYAGGHELTNFSNEIIYTPTTIVSEPIWTHAENPGSATHDRDIFIGSGGNYHWRIFDGGVKDMDSGFAAIAGKQVHILVTADGTNMRIYIDGVLAATQAGGDAYTGFSTPEIMLFRGYDGSGTNTYGDGAASLVRAWDYALDATQVAFLYQNRFGSRRQDIFVPAAAPPVGAIMNQLQGSNMGADLYNGTIQ